MKTTLALLAFLIVGLMAATDTANAVVYCQYVDYPPSCVARPGVVLRARPVARAAVRTGAAVNRGAVVHRGAVRVRR